MVVASLSIGGLIGVLLSGGFVYWEVGRFATPQVPVTLFDERKELFAYTAGLFVGVPLAVLFVLYVDSFANGALPGALFFLAALVGGGEAAQWSLLRSRYWGSDAGRPFYALGLRAGVGGILALTVVAAYAGSGAISPLGIAAAALECLAVIALQVAAALLSYRAPALPGREPGGPVSGILVGAVGFFLIGLGPLAGSFGSLGGASVALVGATLAYLRRRPLLNEVEPPAGPPTPPGELLPYGRTLPSGGPGTPHERRP